MKSAAVSFQIGPREFWAMSPVELFALYDAIPKQGGMTKEKLAELMAKFPDTPAVRNG